MDLKTVYKTHKNMVYNLALQYTRNIQEAEEITQDVFIQAFQNRDKFEQRARLKTWLYRITVNKSLDYIKARGRKKRWAILNAISIGTGGDELELGHFNHPGVDLEQKEAVQHIFICLDRLKDNQKTVIILMKIQGLSQAETADVMAISIKAVESLFQRAKKNLRDILNQNEGVL